MSRKNFFEMPEVTERNLMPHVADLMLGAERVELPLTLGESIRVFGRAIARFNGEIAAWDGATVPVGLRADDEVFDVVFMAVENDGSSGIGVMRQGSRPRGGVRAGTLMVNSGTVAVSTVEQLRSATPELLTKMPFVVAGEVSDSVRIHNGFGDGPVGMVALVDEDDQMCGLVVGDLFEAAAWEERILPGEGLMSIRQLREELDEWGAEDEPGPATPLAVYRGDELLGYVAGADHHGSTMLILEDAPRPTSSSAGARQGDQPLG